METLITIQRAASKIIHFDPILKIYEKKLLQIPGGGDDGEPAKEDALARLMAIAGKNIITISTIHKLKAFAFF